MRLKEYRIPIPLTLDEYRLGQEWTENELFNETFQTNVTFDEILTDEKRLKIINEKIPFDYKISITSKTLIKHKKYNLKDQKPKFLDVFLFNNKKNLIFDEYTFNNWPYTLTIIENKDYSFQILIQSYYIDNNLSNIKNLHNSHIYFSLNNQQIKYLNDYEIINIAERYDDKQDYRLDEDPTRNISIKKPNLLPLKLNTKWYENWPNDQPSMCVYKLIELILFNEKSLFSKATNQFLWSSIIKTQKMLYHRFHQKMLCNIDKWIDQNSEQEKN